MSVAEGFAAIVGACLRHFRLNVPLVVEQRDVEGLHQARVAVRRLRSALSLFRTAIDDPEFGPIRDELRWFSRELGDARNLDIYLRLALPADARSQFEERREKAYDEVIAAMRSQRLLRLTLDLTAWITGGEWRRANARQRLQPYIARRINRLWRKVRGAESLPSMDDERRHRLRITVKKLRYGLEFAAPLLAGGSARQKAFGRAVEELQEVLGLLNDIAIARTFATADPWPTVRALPGIDERACLAEAEAALGRLRKIGPYWRKARS